MASVANLRGSRFSRLVVIDRAENSGSGQIRWLCKCDCGNTKVIQSGSLKSGKTRSCGCLQREAAAKAHMVHGHNRRGKTVPEFRAWYAMIQRCTNPTTRYWEHYGGRGITVCDEWLNSFDTFFADMGARPPKATLDRKDNDKGYCKENCRWASWKQQGHNRRTNRLITFNGSTKTIMGWAEHLGISYETLRNRIRRGWTAEDAITKPVDKR